MRLLLILWLLPFAIFGQDTEFFTIGEVELANTEVYTILETKDHQLYVGTDQGLFIYKNGKFIPISLAEEQQGSSIFELKCDNNGDVYCCNFGGQIFKIVDHGLTLYAELPKGHISNSFQFEFDHKNQLITASKDCRRLVNGTWEIIKSDVRVSKLSKLPDGRIAIFHPLNYPSLTFIHPDGRVTTHDFAPLFQKVVKNHGFYWDNIIQFGDELVLSGYDNMGNTSLISERGYVVNEDLRERHRAYQFSENSVWIKHSNSGIKKIRLEDRKIVVERELLPNESVSVYHSQNGNVFLGSFGNGVKVIPNLQVKKYNHPEDNKQTFSCILSNAEGEIFRGTLQGKIIQSAGKDRHVLSNHPTNTIDYLYHNSSIQFSQDHLGSICQNNMYDLELAFNLPSIKDVKSHMPGQAYIATAIGVYFIGKSPPKKFGFQLQNATLNYWLFPNHIERCRSIASLNNKIYLGTYSSLIEVSDSIHSREILLDGKSINSYSLEVHKNQLWCGSQKKGVLVFENGQLVKQFSKKQGLSSDQVRKIRICNDQVYVLHKKGFEIIDIVTEKIVTIGLAEGLKSTAIKDFDVNSSDAWFIVNNSTLSIPIDQLKEAPPQLNFHIDSIFFGEELLNAENNCFNYSSNHLDIYYDYRGILYESEAKVEYRIVGMENSWNSTPVREGHIKYNSVPPGKYTLELRIAYRNHRGMTSKISFEVLPPIWQRWWFYIIIIVLTAVILFAIYQRRLRNLKARNFERMERQIMHTNLVESQLRALRSQMNPHFIFNSLSSIQDLVLQEDTDGSYDYLVMFAELVRSTLNYSNKDFIDIEKELAFLDVYLSLEKLRFKEEFEYSISYDGGPEILVPSLMVQPFIENALLHGLMHKSGRKKLSVHFTFTDKLICTIIDNGIGRKKAKAIQKRQNSKHESFALKAIEKRLEIFGIQYPEHPGSYEIIDLMENGEPVGTKVIIVLPYKDPF